jgi:hypothetical protein
MRKVYIIYDTSKNDGNIIQIVKKERTAKKIVYENNAKGGKYSYIDIYKRTKKE